MVGFNYKGRIVTKMFNAGNNRGTAQGMIKRFNRVVLHVLNTLGGFLGGIDYKLKQPHVSTEVKILLQQQSTTPQYSPLSFF
jgi:hypothetical protein